MATPSNFQGANFLFVKPDGWTDEECGSLPVYRCIYDSDGDAILSCWRFSWRERFAILFRGRAWLSIFGATQPPVAIFGTDHHINGLLYHDGTLKPGEHTRCLSMSLPIGGIPRNPRSK